MRHFEKLIFLFVLLTASLCLAIPVVHAQDLDNVTISGHVTDQNGAVIPGASVAATLVATKVERTVIADGDGQYKLIQLAPGVYRVRASFTNFAIEEKTNLTTIAGQTVQLAFVLKPATVTAETLLCKAAGPAPIATLRTGIYWSGTTPGVGPLPTRPRSPLSSIVI